MQNLGKSASIGKDYSYRSCFRLRAIGKVFRNQNMKTLNGTVRFECIIPNLSFQAVRINIIPILSSTLYENLINNSVHNNGKNNNDQLLIFQTPKIGYLTMNQTRKLVFLLENDLSISRIPIIGLWICLHPDMVENCSIKDALYHPYCWGAFTKFIYNSNIKNKEFIAKDTFLLVNSSSSSDISVANSGEFNSVIGLMC